MARTIDSILKARARFVERLVFGIALHPLRLFCTHCGKYVPSDMEWVCGYCDHGNTKTNRFSFLSRCEECRRGPKSFVCPHCGTVHCLDKDADTQHPARKPGPAPVPPLDPREGKRQAHEERKEDLEHKIAIARLNAELAKVKAEVKPSKTMSAREKLEKSFTEHDTHTMAVHEIAKRERQQNAEKYKDAPDLLRMANDSLQGWTESQLL
jgi:hypothetical protein